MASLPNIVVILGEMGLIFKRLILIALQKMVFGVHSFMRTLRCVHPAVQWK